MRHLRLRWWLYVAARGALLALGLTLSACARNGQALPLPLAGVEEDLTYLRRPLPNLWVGTEQERRLRIGARGTVALPVQMGGQDPVAIYGVQGSGGHQLYFRDFGTSAVVNLDALAVSERTLAPDAIGALLGVVVSPEIRDIRFIPGSASGAGAP